MKPTSTSQWFDADYYAHGCGAPYQRDDIWLAFFRGIAGRIVQDIQPGTVLDAGCAMGFLVEALRHQKVDAFGVDVSDYAIQNVHPEIAAHCRVGSVIEPFPQQYDLIVCIEVLEHMSTREAEQAITNFCQYSDDILFSSSPFDYKEVTHFNVHPPEYWAELFARHGFYRDVDFDASFITPWAVRFRRRQEPHHRLVRDYERRFWLLWKENYDLRELNITMRSQLVDIQRQSQEQFQLVEQQKSYIDAIHQGRVWRLMGLLHRGWGGLNKMVGRGHTLVKGILTDRS
ncbi:MAG: methyltransferase domain-containing protein [Ardenticatenales bacterium]|nr:methyltransferase domain-containing protein [Ardenticatenales bacterium]